MSDRSGSLQAIDAAALAATFGSALPYYLSLLDETDRLADRL